MAAIRPDLVVELLLIAPAGYGRLPLAEIFDLPLISTMAQTTMRHAIAHPSVVEFFYKAAVSGGVRPQGSLLQRTSLLEMGSVADAIHALAISGGEGGLRFRRRFYPGPVAAIWGREDALIPHSHIEHLCQTLPQTELEILDGIAHHPQAENPERVTAFLRQGWDQDQGSIPAPAIEARSRFGRRLQRVRVRLGAGDRRSSPAGSRAEATLGR
jgi:pimeloyl-ACP methyl ester carboxylesterase